MTRSPRRPVRASIALAGAGSLGTFVAGASRELLLAVRRHNTAVVSADTDDDPRFLHPTWGKITIDAVGGSSAGAICGSQLVKALFEPRYAGAGKRIDALGTMTGDWIHGASFERLSPMGDEPTQSGPVEAPGWTLLSGAFLYDLGRTMLEPARTASPRDVTLRKAPESPLDPSGVVGMAITLTDMLGYHEPADFAADRVLGHPSFGRPPLTPSRIPGRCNTSIRDLGGRGHAEVRKLFVSRNRTGYDQVRSFLRDTQRRGLARGVKWSSQAAVRLAGLCAASASLPLAIGPIALTDRAAELEVDVRRLYLDGGTLNNKPIAPSLRLSRWHDELRMADLRGEDGCFSLDVIRRELVYDRVCFNIDAFPNQGSGDWRSPHPSEALLHGYVARLTPEAVKGRNAHIDAALSKPTNAFSTLFESVLTSLRAEDIRNIARTNRRLATREAYVAARCRVATPSEETFKVDTFERAIAVAIVLSSPASEGLTEAQVLSVAQEVWEADRYAGLASHRTVTMVPIYAPHAKSKLAGDAMYAMGGLLSQDARRHDATVGSMAAKHVLAALADPNKEAEPVTLPDAPEHVLPRDSAALMDRLRVAFSAMIDANLQRSGTLRFFAKVPVRLRPLASGVKRRLDKLVVRKR